MAQSATILSLPQMVDLALNTPEIGVVNFTVLHTILHVMINRLKLSNVDVEFRGIDSERIQSYIIAASKTAQPCSLTLTEHPQEAAVLSTTPEKETTKSSTEKDKPKTPEKETENTEEKEKPKTPEKESSKAQEKEMKKEASKVTHVKPSKSVDNKQKEEKGKKDEGQKEKKPQEEKKRDSLMVVSHERNVNVPAFSLIISKAQVEEMINDIAMLKSRIQELTDLPNNENIIKAIKSNEDTPVLDMYHVLTLTKRMDAIEIATDKMATLVEDVIKGKDTESAQKSLDNIIAQSLSPKTEAKEVKKNSSLLVGLSGLNERLTELEKTIEELKRVPPPVPSARSATPLESVVVLARSESATAATLSDVVELSMDIDKIDITKLPIKKSLAVLQKALVKLRERMETSLQIMKDLEKTRPEGKPSEIIQSTEVGTKVLDSKLNDLATQINSLDTGYGRQINNVMNRVSDVEKAIGEVLEQIHIKSGETGDREYLVEVQENVRKIQEDLNNMHNVINGLTEESAIKQHAIDVINEQIELLKTVKADREDLEDALADKADACVINRKVSFEQFDQACGDISKTIEEALGKLSQQETLWNQALEDLQKNVGSKMDRNELTPLREFINSKLKNLQEKFKALSAMKKEHEAAGTKSKYLRNVNCISCDKDVVMRKELDPSSFPKSAALPPNRSMAPYLAYELDQLRKQQKCLPTSKNLNLIENALMGGKGPKSVDHLCNRYCGGSHTVTTPQQRVTRMGHFLEQWGPEVAPVQDTLVKGTDGKMYKSRDDEQLKHLLTEKAPSVKADETKFAFKISGSQKTIESKSEREENN